MSFQIKIDKLLKKFTEIWDKVRKIVKKGFDSEPVYNEKYPRTKTSYYEGKMNINFYGYKIPKKIFDVFISQ